MEEPVGLRGKRSALCTGILTLGLESDSCLPSLQLENWMDLDVADADVLKRNVVRLLLKHPQGIKSGDFSGAFYKLHGHHPQLALHGYSSLKQLLTDMKNVVVLEENPQETVIKLASGDPFYQWLAEDEGWDTFEETQYSSKEGLDSFEEGLDSLEDELDSFEEELQNLRSEEAKREAGPFRPASLVDMDFSAYNSIAQKMGGRKSVLAAAFVPILGILRNHPSGLDLPTLTESLRKRGFDLERFSQDMGYSDTISCLLEIPGPHLIFSNGMKPHNCVVQLFSNSPALPAWPLHTGSSVTKPSPPSPAGTSSHPLMKTKPVPLPHPRPPTELISIQTDITKNLNKPISSLTGKKKKKKKKKSQNAQDKMIKSPGEVLALVTNCLSTHMSGLRVKKLEESLLTTMGFDLGKFSVAQGYKDTLDFLEHQMPELGIRYRENRCKSVVKQGPAVEVTPPLFKVQPQVKPPNAPPDFGGLFKPLFKGGVTKAGPGASAPLQNGPCSSLPVPFTAIPNRPSTKEQQEASPGKDESSSQPPPAVPAQPSSTRPFSGRSVAVESSGPADAQVPSKSSLTKPSPAEHLDDLRQQVAHILAGHPEGMSLFQFRAAYSATYQHHLPLGNASSAKQCLLEMSDIVLLKGYGVQTLLFPVSPKEPPTKPGPPVLSKVENAAVVLGDPLGKAVVRPEPAVVSKPSLLKTPMKPQSCTTHPLASDHLGSPDIKENRVLSKGRCPTTPEVVASFQEPVRPKVSSGHLDSSKAEKAVKNLGDSLTEAAGQMEPVVVPKSSRQPSLSQTAPVPGPPLRPFVPSTSTDLRAPGNGESSFFPEYLQPRLPQPSVPLRGNARAGAMLGEHLFTPHSPVVFPPEPRVSTLNGIWISDSFASRPACLASPPFSVNIPVPSLFQPALPVVYPPLPPLPNTLAIPSLRSPSHQLVSQTLLRTQWQKTEPASSHLGPPAPRNRPVQLISPVQRVEQAGCTRPAGGLDPLRSASRTQGQGPSRAAFSAEEPPVFSPPVKPLKSPSLQQPENVHRTWLSGVPCSSVPAADESVAASPSAGAHPKPVVPALQKQSDVVDTPVSSPGTPSSGASQQHASSSFRNCTESDVVPSTPLVSMPQPQHIRVNPAVTSSDAQPPISLHSSRGSSVSPASQPSYVSSRPNRGYDVSRQLPGISGEGSGQDNHRFSFPDNQRYPLQEESAQPSALQSNPPRRSSDNCVIL